MKKHLIAIATALFAVSVVTAASTGSCYKKAKSMSIGRTTPVTLVNEWDPGWDGDKGEYLDWGAYYMKVKLTRGQAYTIWIQGGSTSSVNLDVDINYDDYDDDDIEPSASFDVEEYNNGTLKVATLYADDWDVEDPKSANYYVYLDGAIGASVTVGSVQGIKTFTITGTEDAPKVLSMSDTQKSYASKCIDGEYYFSATLKAGRRYRVRTYKGTKAKPFDLSIESPEGVLDMDVIDDPSYSSKYPYDTAKIIDVNTTGKYTFCVSGDGAQAFQLYYRSVPVRAITKHPTYTLTAAEPSARFVPGRLVNSYNYYDQIIDEQLCRISLKAGDRYVFETDGATNEIEMIAYDSSGKIVARNTSKGDGSRDCRCVVSASKAGWYYVGAYNPLLDVTDAPSGNEIELTAIPATDFTLPDDYDPTDDDVAGATPIVALPGLTNDIVTVVGSSNGVHRLNARDWYDVYALPVRKGAVYTLRAAYADPSDTSALTLGAKVFYMSGSKEVTIATTGTISPAVGAETLEEPLQFTANGNLMVFVRVYVAEARGLDYPAYNLYSMVSYPKTDNFGMLQVKTSGVGGTWSLNAETSKYRSGAVLSVPYSVGQGSRTMTVKFNAVTGFTAPPAQEVVIPSWNSNDWPVVIGEYYDNYDDWSKTVTAVNSKTKKKTTTTTWYTDDVAAGAVAVTPSTTVQNFKRTLYARPIGIRTHASAPDVADHFVFTAAADTFYDITLTDTTLDAVGDAAFSVSNATDGVIATNVTSFLKRTVGTGKTWIIVTHTNDVPVDSSYTLSIRSHKTGNIYFSATAYSAKDNAEYVTLTVKRNGKQGVQRVHWTTVQDDPVTNTSALAGTDYYPENGVLTWADGNNADKTIKVRIIPDLLATYENTKSFGVKLWPMEEDDFSDLEYPALITRDSARVNITEAVAKNAGKIAVSAYGNGDDVTNTVSNVAKPVASCVAGDPLVLTLSRTGGTNGIVAVKLTTPALKTNTAKAGTDFTNRTETVTWADGDGEDKYVTIGTIPSKNYVASKAFAVQIAAVKKTGNATPALAAKSVTAKILNSMVETTSATYAKSVAAVGGIKAAFKGTWYLDREDGLLKSAGSSGTLTYTLTGPGFFAIEPSFATLESNSVMKATVTIDKEKLNVLATNFEGRVVRVLGSGTHTVSIAYSGRKTGEVVAFADDADTAMPFKWVRFALAAPVWPMNKAVVYTNTTDLAWTVPEGLVDEKLHTRLRFGTVSPGKTFVATNAIVSAGSHTLPDGTVTSGKTYYWGLDYAYSTNDAPDYATLKWTSGATWSFSGVAANAPQTEMGGYDAAGVPITERVAMQEPVELIQGVKSTISMLGTNGANRFRVLGGKLPAGITVNATTGAVGGTPTTPGDYTVMLQSYYYKKSGSKTTYRYGTALKLFIHVAPAGTALGTFRGVLTEEGQLSGARRAQQNGLLTVSVTSAGKITAKAAIAGNTYSFTGTGYTLVDNLTPGEYDDFRREYKVRLSNKTKLPKTGKTYTNYLDLYVTDAALTNVAALVESVGTAELTMNVPNNLIKSATAVQADVIYTCDRLYRNNASTVPCKPVTAEFDGYYTVALVPQAVTPADGVPTGNGYLLMTIAANGNVTYTGYLADGTAVSGSSNIGFEGDLADFSTTQLAVPVYWGVNANSFAGVVKLNWGKDVYGAEGNTVDPSSTVRWLKAGSASTRDGAGFDMDLAPCGGWYNKTYNVQTFYLNADLSVSTIESGEDLPAEALASGYSFLAESTPRDLAVKVTGNKLTVAARKLVTDSHTFLYDLGKSTNPWNMTVSYVRATGVVSGKFAAWEQKGSSAQKQIANLVHRGVLLFNRDYDNSPLDVDVWSAGFFRMKATTSWWASLPFNLLATPVDHDWTEVNAD